MSLTTALLRQLARRPSVPSALVALAWPATGVRSVMTSPAAIEAVLADAEVEVPYGDRSRLLGLGSFPLALDGAAHEGARAELGTVLDATGAAHLAGVAAARRAADEALELAGPGGRIDLVADVIDPALQAWCEAWFGLPGEGRRLQATGRFAMHAVFLNPVLPARDVDDHALDAALAAIRSAQAAWLGALAGAPVGTLAGTLHQRRPEATDAVTADLVGLTVGPLALGSKALAIAVDELLDRGALRRLDDAAARRAFEQVLAVRPPLPALPRRAKVPVCPIPGARAPVGPVLALTLAAAQVPSESADPARWAFGVGPHACMGRWQTTDVAAAVLAAIAARSPRRVEGDAGRLRPGPAPAGMGSWPFEGHLEVVLSR